MASLAIICPKQVLVAVGQHVDARPSTECFASFNETGKALKRKGHCDTGLTRESEATRAEFRSCQRVLPSCLR